VRDTNIRRKWPNILTDSLRASQRTVPVLPHVCLNQWLPGQDSSPSSSSLTASGPWLNAKSGLASTTKAPHRLQPWSIITCRLQGLVTGKGRQIQWEQALADSLPMRPGARLYQMRENGKRTCMGVVWYPRWSLCRPPAKSIAAVQFDTGPFLGEKRDWRHARHRPATCGAKAATDSTQSVGWSGT